MPEILSPVGDQQFEAPSINEISLGDNHEEVDFYSTEYDSTGGAVDQSINQLHQVVSELASRQYAPSIVGQQIIHTLARARLNFAADLPYQEEALSPQADQALKQLYRFEQSARNLLKDNLPKLFRNNPEAALDSIIDGATAEECALRLVSQAAPDARLYYPNDEDEHNGIDFFVVGEKSSLAVQVKIIRYRYDYEHTMPLLYKLDSQADIENVCGQAIQAGLLDYPDQIGRAIELQERTGQSLSKNIDYIQKLFPNRSVSAALMPLSTNLLNPRLSEGDVERLEKSDVLSLG